MSNPFFPPALVGLMLHNAYLYVASEGKSDTVPANALGQFMTMATAAAIRRARWAIVMTEVAHTILEDVYDTSAGRPRVGTVEKERGIGAGPIL